VLWSWYVDKELQPLSEFVALSSVHEVERGEETEEVVRLRAGHPVTWSQSNLSRRRYAQNDDTLYVAPEDERTDYSQPPMANWYNGVLNTGKRRYGHPALNGVLPQPWLPLKKGQSLSNNDNRGSPRQPKDSNGQAVVLTLRKRPSVRRRMQSDFIPTSTESPSTALPPSVSSETIASNPWQQEPRRASSAPLHHRLSFDPASGVINLPDDSWLQDDDDTDDSDEDQTGGGLENSVASLSDIDGPTTTTNGEETMLGAPVSTSPSASPSRLSRYGTYFHHPERRRQAIPGAFPR